ncbi:UvrD-helicase domain-containing protein, partial [Pseudomonas paraeruginosa]|uniref:UvrD-helicase domain-containing protein n=1 Tax=Pseudomonas paraeruginosa TaxID=2994495 RepID=UPI003A4C7F6A
EEARIACMLLDEGQDINPVIADIAHWQRIRMAIVGDPHQQLYRFRGAEDALSSDWMAGAEELARLKAEFGYALLWDA